MQSVLETLGITLDSSPSPSPSDLRVEHATITATSPDVATLRLTSGEQAVLPISEYYQDRTWSVGDVLVVIVDASSSRLIASVTRPELVSSIFDGLVPELRSGTVRVMSVARAAGQRSKIAVAATAPGVDPVAALIGREANRVRYVSTLLGLEAIDIVAWHPDQKIYLANALAPARVARIEIDGRVATAYAPRHQMAQAVGKFGLNSQLAGQLLGLSVTVSADGSQHI